MSFWLYCFSNSINRGGSLCWTTCCLPFIGVVARDSVRFFFQVSDIFFECVGFLGWEDSGEPFIAIVGLGLGHVGMMLPATDLVIEQVENDLPL